jgi:predicted metal-dependent phosphoesterase TrpH
VIKVDLHLHSRFSHDSRTTLEALVERCGEIGLDRIALTDHNTAAGTFALAKMAPELTITGQEVKTREGEVIGLFIKRELPAWQRPEQVMDMIHEMGGLVYIPHPLDRNRSHFREHRLVALADRIDILETYNPWCEPAANQAAALIAAELGKVTATGSDAHAVDELGRSWMEMDEYDGSDDFLEKLRGAKHVVTAESGTGRRA